MLQILPTALQKTKKCSVCKAKNCMYLLYTRSSEIDPDKNKNLDKSLGFMV